ncbi:MAG: FAD-binding oxidoreductase, partial [Polyangiaceae bacterium]
MSSTALNTVLPRRVLDGFGRAVNGACRHVAPTSQEELARIVETAAREGLSVGFRGSGRSYGDASINTRGVVIDTTKLNRMISWDPISGILEGESGLTIEGVWRRTIEDGYWPAVVPGTMFPTLAGCASMNIHGKNNFRVGTFGDQIQDIDLLLASGQTLRCSRTENSEVFHAAIGGLGLLGAITRVRLKLKKVDSGMLRVKALYAKTLEHMFDIFEERLTTADYLVGWVDCLAPDPALGRGEVHHATYLHEGEDPEGRASLHVERQGLPPTIMGVPRSILWRFMAPFLTNPGVKLVNTMKTFMAWHNDGNEYLQSHVAFAFLLDYVPNWRLAYGPQGFIQYQVFVPKETAREAMQQILRVQQKRGLPSYLGVMKRHRPDPFLLTHALDGWSMAMDFKVTEQNRTQLMKLTQEMTEIIVSAGGKFYFAKDAVLRAEDVARAYDPAKIARFFELKKQLDPQNLFQ